MAFMQYGVEAPFGRALFRAPNASTDSINRLVWFRHAVRRSSSSRGSIFLSHELKQPHQGVTTGLFHHVTLHQDVLCRKFVQTPLQAIAHTLALVGICLGLPVRGSYGNTKSAQEQLRYSRFSLPMNCRLSHVFPPTMLAALPHCPTPLFLSVPPH